MRRVFLFCFAILQIAVIGSLMDCIDHQQWWGAAISFGIGIGSYLYFVILAMHWARQDLARKALE
jgi:hypothetical protein